MSSSFDGGKMLVFAHRGASGGAPENTMAAFKQAIEKGSDGVELDIHLTADGKVVVIHDATVDRTSDGKGEVAYRNYGELARLDMAARWKGSTWGAQRIPLLEEVIECVIPAGLLMNIEIKGGKASPALAERAVGIIRSYDAMDRVVFSSFDPSQINKVRTLVPSSRRALLSYFPPPLSLGKADDLWGCHPNHLLASKGAVERWHSEGMHVQLWTVNTKKSMQRALRMGADGIITNHPALALAVRDGKIS